MKNARQELIEKLNGKEKVKCAEIIFGTFYGEEDDVITDSRRKLRLKLNYTDADWDNYCISLDFNYSNGYGGQELFGIVWLEDGTWLSRGEYDGSEWWEHNALPEIPDYLK